MLIKKKRSKKKEVKANVNLLMTSYEENNRKKLGQFFEISFLCAQSNSKNIHFLSGYMGVKVKKKTLIVYV